MGWAGCRWYQDHHGSPRGLGVTGQPGGKEAGGKEGMDQVGALRHHPEELEGKKISKKNTRLGKKPLTAPPKSPCRSEWKVRLEQKNRGKGH